MLTSLGLKKNVIAGAFLPFCLSITACSSQQTVDFSVIKESIQCRIQQASIAALDSQQETDKLISQLSPFKDKDKPNNPLAQLFAAHAENEKMFVISQGQKSSAGYGFLISESSGSLVDNTLSLPILFTSPDKNSMQAQMMTSPCLVIGIDDSQHFDQLVVDSLIYNSPN